MWIQPRALEIIILLILNQKLLKFDMNTAWSSRAQYLTGSQLQIIKMIKFDTNPAWGSRVHYLLDAHQKIDMTPA